MTSKSLDQLYFYRKVTGRRRWFKGMKQLNSIRIIIIALASLLSAGCSIKDTFLNGALKSTQAVDLTTLGENHKVGAGQVLISGFCAYGSTIEVTYGSGFDGSSPTTAACGSCSSSENPNCGGFFSSVGKYSFIATLSGTNGARTITLISKDSDGESLSTLTRSFTYEPISQTAYVKPTIFPGDNAFGAVVDMDGDTLVVGANLDPNRSTVIESGTNYTPSTANQPGAAYVFRKISGSWVQEAYLKGIYNSGSDHFGNAVAISGDTIAVGANADDRAETTIFNAGMAEPTSTGGAVSSGAVYIFKRAGSTWTFESYIKAPNAGVSDVFGSVLDLSGDYLVVGAYGEDGSVAGVQNGTITSQDDASAAAGAAYVFKRTTNTWAFQSYLKAPEIDDNDRFGWSVSISGDVIAVGAYAEDGSNTGVTMGTGGGDDGLSSTGAVYLFRRSGNDWTQEAYVKGHAINASDQFGYSVALSGNTLVVGAHGEDSNVTGVLNGTSGSANNGTAASGAAYVFYYDTMSTIWAQQAYLKGSDTDNSDQFGYRVAIDADTIAVAAWLEDSNVTGAQNGATGSADDSVPGAGAVYVFTRSGVNWSQQAYLKAAVTGTSYNFGAALAVNGDTILVGQDNDRSLATGVTMGTTASSDYSSGRVGSVYVFTRTTTNWTQEAYLKPHVKSALGAFGGAMDFDGDTIVVGQYRDFIVSTSIVNGPTVTNPTGATYTNGAAFVFRKVSGSWVQEAYLKAPNAAEDDQFGTAVAISGDTIAVAALTEDNSTTGVQNGVITTDNASAASSGAVYVFTRSGSTWSFQSYLKPAVVVGGMTCGRTLAVNLDTIAVGCDGDASDVGGIVNGVAGGGVNSNATQSGAVYVYKRTGVNWAQEAYIKPVVVRASMRFGARNISISGDVMGVSAIQESSDLTGVHMGTSGGSTDTSKTSSGAAWIFRRTGSNWAQDAFIKAPIATAEDDFGVRVSVNGNDLAIVASGDTTNSTTIQNTSTPSISNKTTLDGGAVYIYRYETTQWILKSFIKPPALGVGMYFNNITKIENNTLFVSATGDPNSNSDLIHGARFTSTANTAGAYNGSVLVYRRLNDEWYFSDYLKAPNSMIQAQYGNRIVVSGNNLAISAPTESSDGTGITNGPVPTAMGNIYYSGAIYIYNLDF